MPLIAAGSDAAFHSLRGLRLIPALAAAATVALTASAAQMLGGASTPAGSPLGLPEESGQTLWLCRDRFEPLPAAWPSLRRYG